MSFSLIYCGTVLYLQVCPGISDIENRSNMNLISRGLNFIYKHYVYIWSSVIPHLHSSLNFINNMYTEDQTSSLTYINTVLVSSTIAIKKGYLQFFHTLFFYIYLFSNFSLIWKDAKKKRLLQSCLHHIHCTIISITNPLRSSRLEN